MREAKESVQDVIAKLWRKLFWKSVKIRKEEGRKSKCWGQIAVEKERNSEEEKADESGGRS